MNPITNELILLSLFFYSLGVATLVVIGFRKKMIPLIGAYAVIVASVVWLTQPKWLLIGGIVFMLIAGFYATLSIGRSMNQCIADLKESNDSNKRGNNNDNS